MKNVNVDEQFMKALLKNSEYMNESYRETLKNILKKFLKDREGCTEKFKSMKRKTPGFSLCAAYILSEDKELEKECKESFDYFTEYLSDAFANDIEKDLKGKFGLSKGDVKVFIDYLKSISDRNPFEQLEEKFPIAECERISIKQKAYKYFDESNQVHNIVQTAFLCTKCEGARIVEMGMRFMKFFTELAPLKILNKISKLYRVKGSCKFLKGRFDEFIEDLNRIEVPKIYITAWVLFYGQSHNRCNDEGKRIYEDSIKKVAEATIEDRAEIDQALQYVDVRKQMAIHRNLIENYDREESKKAVDEIFMDEYIRFMKVNMKGGRDKDTIEKMVAYIKGELDFEEIVEDVRTKFKTRFESCELGCMFGVVSKEYSLRGLKLFVELCDMDIVKGFYDEFKYDIKPNFLEYRKPDRNIYDFTELMEGIGVPESYIYQFLCCYTEEDLEKPSRQPKDEFAQRLYRFAKDGQDVLGNLISAYDEEKIFAIYQTGLLSSQLNSLVKMLDDSSIEVVKAALHTIKWAKDEEIAQFKDKIDEAEKRLEAMVMDTPVEGLKRALKKFSKEALLMKLSEGEEVHRWDTKLGGKPYLPIGEEYPAEGMKLLAQINFEEIPKMKGYPDKGLVQFYVVVDESDTWHDYSIRYFSEIIKDESKLQNDLPEMSYDDCDPILKGEVKVSCTKVEETPAWHDYLLEGEIREILDEMYSDEDEESDVLDEYEESRRINKHNSIGGYPYFTDEDPREYDVITALPGMEYGEVFGEVSYENEWVCLLALYDSGLGEFGQLLYEEGSIHFFIRRVDLEKGDFSDIKYSRFTY